MNYEDRLHVWCIALLKGMPYWNGRGLLIPPGQAVEKLNASPHLDRGDQLRAVQLNEIVAEFKDTAPPYPSFDPRLKQRAEKRRDGQQNEWLSTASTCASECARSGRLFSKFRGDSGLPKVMVLDPQISAKTAKRGSDSIGKF